MDVNVLADSIFCSFKAYCAKEVERRVAKSHEELLARIAAIPAGKDGAPGPQGEPGKDGRDGVDGKDGAPGIDGKDGAPGLDGKDGAAGIDGKEGAPGKNGMDGKDGADGRNGKDGANGIDGKDGAPGKDGLGLKGEDGRDGRDGLEGPPGRDALRLDVLDGIDVERSYARGTFACYGGGTIRAFRVTDPLDASKSLEQCGWQVVMRGLMEVREEDVDERTTKRIEILTDGRTIEHIKRTPVMIYRGIWKDGTYERGDVVTWGGSLWHCERATSANPQKAGCDDWKLVAKKGRDGENGKPGERGQQGPPGKNGRDFTNLGTPIT